MPLALAGIPWLAGVLGGLFTSVFAWAANFLTKRFAVTAAIIAVIVTVTTAFFAGISAIVSGVASVAPAELTVAAGLVIPSNATLCISSYMAALVLRWAYQWNVRVIQYKLF